MRNRDLLLALFTFALVGCPAVPEFPTWPESGSIDAGTAGGGAAVDQTLVPELCRRACKNLNKLGCAGRMGSPGYDDVWGTDDDIPCAIVCAEIEEAAREVPGLSLNPACQAKALDCRQASECIRTSSGL